MDDFDACSFARGEEDDVTVGDVRCRCGSDQDEIPARDRRCHRVGGDGDNPPAPDKVKEGDCDDQPDAESGDNLGRETERTSHCETERTSH